MKERGEREAEIQRYRDTGRGKEGGGGRECLKEEGDPIEHSTEKQTLLSRHF